MATKFDLRAFVNAWNTQNADKIVEFYADDAEIVVPPDEEPYRGKQGVRQNVEEVMRGIGDINADVETSVQEGNKVAAVVHVSGRHTGEMPVSDRLRIPSTGRDVRFRLGVFLDLNDQGKIRREIDLADNIGLLQQVGAMEQLGVGGGATTGTQQTGRAR